MSLFPRSSPFVHTYPDIFESATFSFRDTPYVHTYLANKLENPELLEYALQSGYFLIRFEFGGR